MLAQVDTDRLEASHVLLDHVGGGRFQNHLKLHVLIETIRIVAVAAVGGASAGLHIGGAIGLRAKHAEESLRAHGARADFHIERLLDNASALAQVLFEAQDHLLERQ